MILTTIFMFVLTPKVFANRNTNKYYMIKDNSIEIQNLINKRKRLERKLQHYYRKKDFFGNDYLYSYLDSNEYYRKRYKAKYIRYRDKYWQHRNLLRDTNIRISNKKENLRS